MRASLFKLRLLLGTVLRIHPSTLALTQQLYANVFIEIDVSKPFINTLWIGTSKDYGWSISVKYENNPAYCQYCGLLGHAIGLCRKKFQVQRKAVVGEETDKLVNVVRGNKPQEKEEWVVKAQIQ